ncbi:hypothetical protein WJ978_24150 [Achromobacter xylosoxidans]
MQDTPEPRGKAGHRAQPGQQVHHAGGQLGVEAVRQQGFLDREMVVQRALGNVRLGRDLLHGDDLVAQGLEQAVGGLGQMVQRLLALALAQAGGRGVVRIGEGHGAGNY